MASEQDRRAFAARLDTHFRANYAMLVRRWASRAGGVSQAEDLIQDGYAALYRAYAEGDRLGDSEQVLAAALHTTIRNALIDRLRRNTTRANIDAANPQGPYDVDSGGEDSDFLSGIADDTVQIEDELAMRDLCSRVMAKLAPHWRGVISLLLADRGVEDIAEIFGRDGYTIRREARSHFCRALASFAAVDFSARWIGQRVCGWADA